MKSRIRPENAPEQHYCRRSSGPTLKLVFSSLYNLKFTKIRIMQVGPSNIRSWYSGRKPEMNCLFLVYN